MVHVQLRGSEPARHAYFGDLPVTRLPFDPRRPTDVARSLSALRKLARQADVVHSMAFSSLGVLTPLAPTISNRWVHTEHWSGVAIPGRVSGVWRRLSTARYLLRLPRRVSAVSKLLADTVANFARRDAVDIVPCVVPDLFEPTPQPPWAPLKLVAVGGLIEGKRPHLAVDAVRELVRTGLDVRLTWVGDGVLRSAVERHAAEAGLTNRIDFIGAVSQERVAERLRAANIFFLPTAFENFLAAGAEAIACGRPVVLPETGGFVDYVTDANGVLARDDDPQSLADAIRLAHDRFVDVSPEHISATVSSRFSEAAVADMFDQFYRRLSR